VFAIHPKCDKIDYNNDQPIIILSAAHKLLPNRSQGKRSMRCGSAAAHL